MTFTLISTDILKLYYNGKTVNIQGHESTEISHVFVLSGHTGWLKPDIFSQKHLRCEMLKLRSHTDSSCGKICVVRHWPSRTGMSEDSLTDTVDVHK